MQALGLNEIREKFLSFFEGKGHLRLPSAPLVPQNDKSLLLINSGMAPLKPYFTGAEKPPSTRSYLSKMYKDTRYREGRTNRSTRNIF